MSTAIAMQSGTTTRLIKRIEVKRTAERNVAIVPNRNARVRVQVSPKLRKKLARYYPSLDILEDEDIPLPIFTEHFKQICKIHNIKDKHHKKSSDAKKITLELYKQALIISIRTNLLTRMQKTKVKKRHKKKRKKIMQWIKIALFTISNAIMLPVGAFSAFVGFESMIPLLIPTITEGAAFGVALGLTIVDFFLQGLAQAVALKDNLGVSLPSRVKKLLNAYTGQIQGVDEINQLLQRPEIFRTMRREEYRVFADTTVCLNDYIQNLKSDDGFTRKPKERKIFTGLRWGATALQAIMIVGAGYFTAAALLSALAAPLLGTPVGWIIISLVILGMLAGYLCLRDNAMRNMMSPALKRFKQVCNRLTNFIFMDNFDHILGNRNNFKNEIKETEATKDEARPQIETSPHQGMTYVKKLNISS